MLLNKEEKVKEMLYLQNAPKISCQIQLKVERSKQSYVACSTS